MRLPGEINRAMRASAEPKRLGDEGLLSPVVLNGDRYYAKQWRGRHHQHPDRDGLFYGAEVDRSGVSPFWARLKFLEYGLMHELFPDRIVRLEAAYDPRIGKDGGSFDYRRFRPVTLSREIVGDPELFRLRNEIVDGYYSALVDREILDGRGRVVKKDGVYEELLAAARVDRRMQEEFGKDLGIRTLITAGALSTKDRRDALVRQIEKAFPGTRIAELVAGGVIPVHAEFNFIPVGRPDARGANEVFVEAAIFDPERFAEALAAKRLRDGETSAESVRGDVARKVGRYQLFRKLDEFYDELFSGSHGAGEEDRRSSFSDPDAVRAVHACLEEVRARYDRDPAFPPQAFWWELQDRVIRVILARTRNDRAAAVAAARRWVRDWRPGQSAS